MKRIVIFYVLILTSLSVFSQEKTPLISIDERLYAKYQSEYLLDIQANSPVELKYLNWLLDNAYEIKNASEEKPLECPMLKYFDKETKMSGCEVSDYNEESFNIMEYDIEIAYDKSTVYRIGNTGKMLVFYSSKNLTQKFNKYLDENK